MSKERGKLEAGKKKEEKKNHKKREGKKREWKKKASAHTHTQRIKKNTKKHKG